MRRLFLFLKAYQPGLFDEQVTVSGHATKTGKYVQAYQAKRKKRHDEPQAGDLFAEADRKEFKRKYPNYGVLYGVEHAGYPDGKLKVIGVDGTTERFGIPNGEQPKRFKTFDEAATAMEKWLSKQNKGKPEASFAEAAAPKPKGIPGVDPATVTRLEKEVTAAKAAADRERAASERLHASDNIPGSLQAGGSNYSLGKKREAMNNRLADQHQKLQAAERRLRDAESKLEGYRSGEYHENGQPRADAPSRTAAKKAAKDYAGFIRATVKPGDRITFLQNPDSAHTAVKMNQKTITVSGGTAWPYEDITPWIDGKPTTPKEAMQAFKRWREAESPAPEAPAPKPKESAAAMKAMRKYRAEAGGSPDPQPWDAADAELHAKIAAIEGKRYKSANEERMIPIYRKRMAADPSKWAAGQGVGWHATRDQINRGYRVKRIDAESKMALIGQVADTGLTTSGGNNDRMSDEWVHIGDLIRDNKYNAPGFKKSASITEPAAELIGEHRRLVRVLRSPSHADDLKEADEQEAELREYERKAKRKKKVCKAFLVAPLHQLLKARAHA